jgi:hypothetical protein
MAKKPEPPKPIIWNVYKIAATSLVSPLTGSI